MVSASPTGHSIALPVLLLLLHHTLPCASFSSGAATSCDVYDKNLGVTKGFMELVTPAVKSPIYKLSSPQSDYTPCQQVKIEIDVLQPGMKYIGLLLYAVVDDGKETKVGGWTIPVEKPRTFWTPGPADDGHAGCNGHALLHAGAADKNYHYAFTWKAPAAGTGKVVFRALIKYGETNGGAFYWPQDDLKLAESTAVAPRQVWHRGLKGESCTAVCTKIGATCDAAAMDAVGGKRALFEAAVSKHFTCQLPLLHDGCSSGARPSTGGEGWCFLPESSCPAAAADPCGSVDTDNVDGMRFCACTGGTSAAATASGCARAMPAFEMTVTPPPAPPPPTDPTDKAKADADKAAADKAAADKAAKDAADKAAASKAKADKAMGDKAAADKAAADAKAKADASGSPTDIAAAEAAKAKADDAAAAAKAAADVANTDSVAAKAAADDASALGGSGVDGGMIAGVVIALLLVIGLVVGLYLFRARLTSVFKKGSQGASPVPKSPGGAAPASWQENTPTVDDPLPPGWAAAVDPGTGATYYYDDAGNTSWTRPDGRPKTEIALSPVNMQTNPNGTFF